MLPEAMVKPVLIAGGMLCVMSIVDTLAYGVRTAGVLTRKLAISLSLFNILVISSRGANALSAPILGNFPDKVYQGQYTVEQVLLALRYDLLFVVLGVMLGAFLMPTLIKLFQRGVQVLEVKGSLPRTMWHGLTKLHRVPGFFVLPRVAHLRAYSSFGNLPYAFLVYNIFVTCFYSIGVMSTVLAASIDHSVAGTTILLSGSVNVIATLLLFVVVDPPGAVVVEQCISGQRPVEHAKMMNLGLVATRLLGTLLAILLLPAMAQYVLVCAYWVDGALATNRTVTLSEVTANAAGVDYELHVVQVSDGSLRLSLQCHNGAGEAVQLKYASASTHRFILRGDGQELWRSDAGLRSAQVVTGETLGPHMTQRFEAGIPAEVFNGFAAGTVLEVEAVHNTLPATRFIVPLTIVEKAHP
jgi:hypothetical protein